MTRNRTPAYVARDGLIHGHGESLTISDAADKAESFTRTAAETSSPALAAASMTLATDLISAIHTIRAELAGRTQEAA